MIESQNLCERLSVGDADLLPEQLLLSTELSVSHLLYLKWTWLSSWFLAGRQIYVHIKMICCTVLVTAEKRAACTPVTLFINIFLTAFLLDLMQLRITSFWLGFMSDVCQHTHSYCTGSHRWSRFRSLCVLSFAAELLQKGLMFCWLLINNTEPLI